MLAAAATWKRVAMSLRSLSSVDPTARGRVVPRPLRLERLSQRRLLASDAAAVMQYTAGATIPGEVAGPLLPESDFGAPLEPWHPLPPQAGRVYAQCAPWPTAESISGEPMPSERGFGPASFQEQADSTDEIFTLSAPAVVASMGGSTTLDSSCAALEILIAGLEGQLQAILDEWSNTEDPMQRAALEHHANNVSAAISSAQESLANLDCDGSGSSGSSGGTSGGGTGGTTYDPSGGSSGGGSSGGSSGGGSSGGGTTSGTGNSSPDGSSGGSTSGTSASGGSGSGTGTSGSGTAGGGSGTDGGGSAPDASSGTTGGSSGTGAGSGSGGTTGGSTSSTGGGNPGGTSSGTSGGSSSGTGGEGSGGTTSGSSWSPTGPTTYTLHDIQAGAFDFSSGMDVGVVREGEHVKIAGRAEGPFWDSTFYGPVPPPPPLIIRVDANFDGDFDDEGETIIADLALHNYFDGAFSFYVLIRDDGPSPGNATASDSLNIELELGTVTTSASATVVNVPPTFTSRPTLSFDTDEGNNSLAVVTLHFTDPGLLDVHTATVHWGDGAVTEMVYEPAPGEITRPDKTMRVVRQLGAGAGPLRPLSVTLSDDDTGEAVYQMLTFDVRLNNDDDNDNSTADYLERTVVGEDDVIELSLSQLLTEEFDLSEGRFDFTYDYKVIRVWDSADKQNLILPNAFGYYSFWESETIPAIPYTGQESVWIEGVSIHTTTIAMSWLSNSQDFFGMEETQFLGDIRITVWGLDYDIDSDNNNGFNYPENSDWEEYLEDHSHAIGKLIYPNDTHFTPTRIRLNRGLDPQDQQIRIRLDFNTAGQSGVIHAWNTHKANPNRVAEYIEDGGNWILPGTEYTLQQLGYDPASGGITIYLGATHAWNTHDTKQGVITSGKPDDRISASIVGLPVGDMHDEVKYMVVNPNTFYPNLQARPELRAAMASEGVYAQADLPAYALEKLNQSELADLFGRDSNIPSLIGAPATVPGFGNAIYRDLVSGQYVLSFAGTDSREDWIDNLRQNLRMPSQQYIKAMEISDALVATPKVQVNGMVLTGHSLGGGLASAGSVVTGGKAYTFNAAGLREETLLEWDAVNMRPIRGAERYQGSLARYANATQYVDAYWLDWDILSNLQDNSLFVSELRLQVIPTLVPNVSLDYVFQPAIGTRIEMDGPLDEEIEAVLIGFEVLIMGIAHKTDYYQYGLMVDERSGWNIYGVPLSYDVIPNVLQ